MTNTKQLERSRSEAARNLFGYVFQIRHERQPQTWEWTVGLALLRGDLKVERPPASSQLRAIHHVVEDVALALQLPALLNE